MSLVHPTTSRARDPEDIVAIFHCTFHPTHGNVIDWSLKASDELNLNGVEFSTLPSGLHVVDEDVVHFTQQVHHGISIFRRTPTVQAGMRGFRLESLGILVARSAYPRPWRHLRALKELVRKLDEPWTPPQSSYSDIEAKRNWKLLEEWYSHRMFRRVGEEGTWLNWEDELASECPDQPVLRLPHVLRILGPSALTMYKHVLARRRVLIYTHPVVEPACILAQIASDICGEGDRPNVLGMVGINDVDKLNTESWRGNGWIACTTDAIFLEKPSLYDLVIDFTTNGRARPSFFVSRATAPTPRGPRHRLHPVRFTFSDVRLWSELERILRADSEHTGFANDQKTRWSDSSQMYEDACIVCAGMWIGGLRNGATSYGSLSAFRSRISSTTSAFHLDGEDQRIRNVGLGIEGRPVMSINQHSTSNDTLSQQARTTLALLNIFYAHSEFLSERLSDLLDEAHVEPEFPSGPLVLKPRDVMALELSVLSALDARFVEWLAERNEKSGGRKVIVRRGWKDLLGVLLGFA